MTHTLQRTYYPDRTEGWWFDESGRELCVTMELPWDDNEQEKSCIPESTYQCTAYNSPAHPHVWQVNNVPDRSDVLIHNGNFASDDKRTDTLGCLLVGDRFGMIDGQNVVLNSDATLGKLRGILPDSFDLTITEKTTTPEETLPWPATNPSNPPTIT